MNNDNTAVNVHYLKKATDGVVDYLQVLTDKEQAIRKIEEAIARDLKSIESLKNSELMGALGAAVMLTSCVEILREDLKKLQQ